MLRECRAHRKSRQSRQNEEGQGLVEYGLILSVVALMCVMALNSAGSSVNNLLQTVASSLSTIT